MVIDRKRRVERGKWWCLSKTTTRARRVLEAGKCRARHLALARLVLSQQLALLNDSLWFGTECLRGNTLALCFSARSVFLLSLFKYPSLTLPIQVPCVPRQSALEGPCAITVVRQVNDWVSRSSQVRALQSNCASCILTPVGRPVGHPG